MLNSANQLHGIACIPRGAYNLEYASHPESTLLYAPFAAGSLGEMLINRHFTQQRLQRDAALS